MHLETAHSAKLSVSRQLNDVDSQITTPPDQIVASQNARVTQAYEARIEALEEKRLRLAEQTETIVPAKGRFEEFIERRLYFLSNPWEIYKSGDLALTRTALKLSFAEPLRTNR